MRYGKGDHNRLFREKYDLHRLALHAVHLSFPHPRGSERVTVHAPVSGELRKCLGALELLGE